MIAVLIALAYGLIAGLFLSLAPFAIGLLAGVAAAIALDASQSTALALLGKGAMVAVVGQVGYFTAVFARAVRIDARSANRGREAAVGDLSKKIHVSAKDRASRAAAKAQDSRASIEPTPTVE